VYHAKRKWHCTAVTEDTEDTEGGRSSVSVVCAAELGLIQDHDQVNSWLLANYDTANQIPATVARIVP
jgi:hypothetical protein